MCSLTILINYYKHIEYVLFYICQIITLYYLFKALDKMLLYLRIVHSVDFYNHSEYVNEDEMPNRCGIMHARCALPSNIVGI